MNDKTTSEFYYQIISLLISIIVVHLFYMAIVRPEAEEILMNQRKNQEQEYISLKKLPFILR